MIACCTTQWRRVQKSFPAARLRWKSLFWVVADFIYFRSKLTFFLPSTKKFPFACFWQFLILFSRESNKSENEQKNTSLFTWCTLQVNFRFLFFSFSNPDWGERVIKDFFWRQKAFQLGWIDTGFIGFLWRRTFLSLTLSREPFCDPKCALKLQQRRESGKGNFSNHHYSLSPVGCWFIIEKC